jgi:hypothetical protein
MRNICHTAAARKVGSSSKNLAALRTDRLLLRPKRRKSSLLSDFEANPDCPSQVGNIGTQTALLIRKGGGFPYAAAANPFDYFAAWGNPGLALQPKLGLLSEWRTRSGSLGFPGPAPAGSSHPIEQISGLIFSESMPWRRSRQPAKPRWSVPGSALNSVRLRKSRHVPRPLAIPWGVLFSH